MVTFGAVWCGAGESPTPEISTAVTLERDAKSPNVVLVDACRTPFVKSGGEFQDMMSWDLGRHALKSLISRNALDTDLVDHVYMGTVIAEPLTSNIAREAMLGAGFSNKTPANTVTLACISSNVAMTNAIMQIKSGNAKVVVAGGAETMSDVPIRLSRAIRKRLLDATLFKKVKGGLPGYLKLMKGMKVTDLAPQTPGIAEFSTGEIMGHSADRLAARFGVTRQEQDEFAMRSHQNAHKAQAAGLLTDVAPVKTPKLVAADNGIKGDSTMETLGKLKPAFIKPHGTITAANSSYLSDGASAALVMREDVALSLGYKPLAYLRSFCYVSQDPVEELLLGPAYAIAKMLKDTGLTMKDIDVFEFHEAFAGQVLANLKALDSAEFSKATVFGGGPAIGSIPMEKLNNWGGSVSIGHPFGATGIRLNAHAANRLIAEDGKLAMIAACAAGGQAFGGIIERYPSK